MNEINNETTVDEGVVLIPVLDENGQPTGEFRPSETTPEEATIFATAEDGEHTVH